MSSIAATAGALPQPRAGTKEWIAVLAGMIGAFMAILNIQITNASLLNIEGGIGTGVDNGSWISTSYLIGEIVVIPLTDYLSRVFSFRKIMLSFATLFAAFSVACAFTHDLPSMIAMRALQGFFGGVLIPMAFTLVFTKLPKVQQPIGLAMFSLAVTFAPAVSLTLFVINELIVEKPLIKLRLLTQRSFGLGTVSAVFVGFALFGSVYLLPAYLGQVQHYNAEQIGTVLAWTGLPQLLLIPLVPKLMQRFDIRYIAFAGMSIFALSSFMNTAMSLNYSGDQLFVPNIVRAVGQALMLAPL